MSEVKLYYLRAWRRSRGLRQSDLGPHGWISDLERGVHGATLASARNLAAKLGISVTTLLRSSPPQREVS